MTINYSIKTAFRGLSANKSRSALTILGIVIGITAIIIVMSLGQGAQNLILNQIQGLGSKTIAVIPGREPSGPSDAAQIFSDSLKETDLALLLRKENAPSVKTVMPVVFGGETASFENETYRLTIFGTSELFSPMFDTYPHVGNAFTAEDVRARADVVLLGSKVKEELFGDSDALNRKVKIKGRSFRVIGVLPKKGQVSFFNFDEMAVVPYTTAQQYIFGIKYYHRFIVEAESDNVIDQAVQEVTATLRESHDIHDPSKDDFFVQSQADLAERLGVITSTLTLFLVAVAAISLLVGGVGIMNIMLVSVTERTREIGLRKAVGATNNNILTQFMLEAIMLTLLGGIIGIILGSGIAFLVSVVLTQIVELPWNFSFPFFAAFLGLIVSASVGLVFGIYPARQASKKSPMEALRYE